MTARAPSLEIRQLLAASLGLIAFLGLTGYALDQAFAKTATNSLRERMQGYASAYYAGGEISRKLEFQPPYMPPDPRFSQPGSGLYAAAIGPKVHWISASTLDRDLPLQTDLAAGRMRLDGPMQIIDRAGGPPENVYRFAMGVIWEDGHGKNRRDIPFVFNVFENTSTFDQQIGIFRRALWRYLGAAGLLLLIVQVVAVRWSLLPLRRLQRDLQRVQRGHADRLSGAHPRELAPLADSINAFIVSEREHLDRNRNTFSDLAHSLKTPLAVLRASLDEDRGARSLREDVRTQVQRMNEIVSYQLSRGASTGHRLFAAPLDVRERAEGIVTSLEKVYAAKGVLCEFDLDDKALFHGDDGDLMELLGNLLENAFKWARSRVLLTTRNEPGGPHRRPGLMLVVDDDGPGIPPEHVEHLLQRGVRGDERVQGHGIGLSIVQDIVRAYHGELQVDASPELGGARFCVRIPPGL
ncbi:MAG: two-component sensor histidine kinase [Proteobacteria bacterium]|nr:two-component sensor histidine kinase [Pseudomonadota bacterium]